MSTIVNPALDNARWFAKQGAPVHPLKPGTKTPATPRGFHDATTDPDTIDRWARQFPGANWGMANGHLDVIDLDGDKGLQSAREFFGGEELPVALGWMKTPGGLHGYLPSTGRDRRTGALPGVDLLGRGGYTVLPGSLLDDGRFYDWEDGWHNLDETIDLEPWLRLWDHDTKPAWTPTVLETTTRVRDDDNARRYALGALENENAILAATCEGSRNHQLNRSAFACGQLMQLSDEEIGNTLGTTAVQIGLQKREIDVTLRSGIGDGRRNPRIIPAPSNSRPVSVREVDHIDLDTGEVTEPEPQSEDLDTASSRFWNARPELATIRDFARARLCAPYAVLGVVLTRISASVPPHIQLPKLVGGVGNVNVFVALVGESGGGKGASERCAFDAVELAGGEEFATLGVGSGEGVAHMYASRTKDGVTLHNKSVLFTIAEVDTLAALKGRQGSTLLPELRKAWSGEDLGFSYVDPSKRIAVAKNTYRLAVLAGVQPSRAGVLLDDADGGTPQRFWWTPTHDPHAPDVEPSEPESFRWTMPATNYLRSVRDGSYLMPVAPSAAKLIRDTRKQKLRTGTSDLDGHALYTRLKVAALLGLLNGRPEVSEDDWALSGHLMAVSDHTRAQVQQTLRKTSEKANTARAMEEGRRAVITGEVVEAEELQRACTAITRKLAREGEWVAGHVARKSIASKLRRHFDEAVAKLEETGAIRVEPLHAQGEGIRLRMAVKA